MKADQTVEVRKQEALKLLAPLGFVDNDDQGEPGTIYHPVCGAIDISYLHVEELVKQIYDAGFNAGSEKIRSGMRQLLGVSPK